MQQIVFDLECEEGATRPKHAIGFAKRVFLSGAGAKMVEHQNRDGRRKRALREGQRRGVGLHDSVLVFRGEPDRKTVTPFEARYSRRQPPQSLGAGAGSCAKFKHVVTQ